MKKVFVFFVALAVTMSFAWSANAANTVQVTLTSPTIVKTGCEKVGSVTFAFDAGSVLTVGDWWYMDLPTNTYVCTALNYLIVGSNAGTARLDTAAVPTFAGNTTFSANDSIVAATQGTLKTGASGPVFPTLTGTAVDGVNAAYKSAGNMGIRVTAAQNSRRVLLTVLSDTAASTITVAGGYSMLVKILDGLPHAGAQTANTGNSMIVLDANANNVFNDGGGTTPDIIANPQPCPENTLCVNAEQMAGDLMYVSFASLNDKFTFTGDSQIAHTGSAAAISLAACKGVTAGEILLAAQGGCTVDYELDTGYCTADAFDTQAMTYGVVGGNKLLIQASTTFGEAGDLYQVSLYSDTAGVYFTAAPTSFTGYLPTQTPCTTALGGGTATGAAWTSVNESGTSGVAYPAAASCSAPSATSRVRQVITNQFAGINVYNALELDIPAMAYDTAIVGDGTTAIVRVSLSKYPCGEIFSASRTIGTFVSTCSPAAGATMLLFPFIPAMDGSFPGWWGGFLIVNGSATAGTATLAFVEEDGDMASYTTPDIPANGGQWNPGTMATLLSMVTPSGANPGTFGDSNVSITATCNFTFGAGFCFTGNGEEGTGYTAYALPGSGWN